MHYIIDSHEDIAWNILTFNRDITRPVAVTRQMEKGSRIIELNFGEAMLGWPEYQAGRVAVIFATLFAAPRRYEKDPYYSQAYTTIDQAHACYQRQLETYNKLFDEHPEKFILINDRKTLSGIIEAWERPVDQSVENPIGLVLLMEGAEGIREVKELASWWENGVRLIGPAWAGNQYCGGTLEPGPLTTAGKILIRQMDEIGFMLDISHMDEQAVLHCLEFYRGPIIASHANAQALVHSPINRFLNDAVILAVLERGGVIGIVPYNHHLVWEWKYPNDKHAVKLDAVSNQIDHICQLAGDALHVGIGSDFDGGLGMQSTPSEIDTIADLQKIAPMLTARGFTDQDVASILGGNWAQLLQHSLP
ncbi:MAG: membrane dipeptidase [Anaerolineaceae bacterium]|nr:membrane dipeptidase [Anaerolineaceae bacterium]